MTITDRVYLALPRRSCSAVRGQVGVDGSEMKRLFLASSDFGFRGSGNVDLSDFREGLRERRVERRYERLTAGGRGRGEGGGGGSV